MRKHQILTFAFLLWSAASWAQSGNADILVGDYKPGQGLWFSSKDYQNRLNLQAYVQTEFQTTTTEKFASSDDRYRIRRARIQLDGIISKYHLVYRFRFDVTGLIDSSANGIENELWLAWVPNKHHQVTFGQRQTLSDNLERSIDPEYLAFPEMSNLTSAFAAIRDFGIFYDGNYNLKGKAVLEPAVSVVTGDGVDALGHDYGGLKYEARLNFLPLGSFLNGGQFKGLDNEREFKPKILIGGYFSYDQGTSSRNGNKGGYILYEDINGHVALPNYYKSGIDLMVKYRGFSLLGEYTQGKATVPSNIFYRVRTDGTVSSTFLLPNSTANDVSDYVKSRMILGSGYNFQLSYLTHSRYSFGVRYSVLSPDTYSFLSNATYWDRNQYYEFCVGKYLSKSDAYKVQASIGYNTVGSGAVNAEGAPVTTSGELVGYLLFQYAL